MNVTEAKFFGLPNTNWSCLSLPCLSLFDVEPGKDVDYAHHHVKHNLLPLADAEVCLTVNNPEGHYAPVQHDENSKVKLEHRGKQSKCDYSGGYSEKVPAELNNKCQVADGFLVITRLSQGLLV